MIYIGILATIFVVFLLYGYLSNYFLSVTSYPIQDRHFSQDPIRICFLSDLHCCQFGKNNCRLIKKIQELNPDVILISGDLIVKNGRHTERALGLLKELSLRYPVYYSPGNHEIKMPGYEEYRRRVRAMGISYLENQTAEMGNAQICGLDLPLAYYHKVWQKQELSTKEMEMFLGKKQEDRYTILLAHNPEYFSTYKDWGADLILSGHVHGGIMRIPVLGGVIAPSLQLFPRYDAGVFHEGDITMILSRGLGTHHIKLRFFNAPELIVIDVQADVSGN